MSRLRLAAGVGLFALAGWYAGRGRGERDTLGRLLPGDMCPDCPHFGRVHDPDLGCTGWEDWRACPCRRLRCRCPQNPPGAR